MSAVPAAARLTIISCTSLLGSTSAACSARPKSSSHSAPGTLGCVPSTSVAGEYPCTLRKMFRWLAVILSAVLSESSGNCR
eukprot:8097441-Pyramimonas_sp.AAC.1